MRHTKVLVTSMVTTVMLTGCATRRQVATTMRQNPTAVAVRFVLPPQPIEFLDELETGPPARMSLAIDEVNGGVFDENCLPETWIPPVSSHHVVLWGGPFDGEDVTYSVTSLPPGDYMFGLFDQDRSEVYQGWMSVHNTGDELLNVLIDWRKTIHEEMAWLGFDSKMKSKFGGVNTKTFNTFAKQLRSLDRLDKQLDEAVRQEMKWRMSHRAQVDEMLNGAEVLLMPGGMDFFLPTTRSAFSDADLASVQSNEALTKVVLLADYGKATEKLQRVTNLHKSLKRCRTVLAEQARQLEKRKQFYMMTDHLYHHDKRFVRNERRLQKTLGAIDRIGQQMAEHRRRSMALAFMAGLAAPGEAADVFDGEERALKHDKAVLREEQRQIEARYNATNDKSVRRVSLQRIRHNRMAAIEEIDAQLAELAQAKTSLRTLKASTSVIHRHGPARLMTATLLPQTLPAYLADAIERESLMTVRLQAVDSLYAPKARVASMIDDGSEYSWSD